MTIAPFLLGLAIFSVGMAIHTEWDGWSLIGLFLAFASIAAAFIPGGL